MSSDDVTGKHFGARMKRLEDDALLRGAGRFVDDIRLPGTLHAAFVRCPYAHARVRAIDTTAALAAPGIRAVLTYRDLPAGLQESRIPLRVPNAAIREPRMPYCMTGDEVAQVGEPVAVVLGDSRHVAEDAAALVAVEYERLPVVADCRAALEPGSPTPRMPASRTMSPRASCRPTAMSRRRSSGAAHRASVRCGSIAAAATPSNAAPRLPITSPPPTSSPSGSRARRRTAIAACSR